MKPNYYQQKINQAVAYINEHLDDEIRIHQLAGVANFSTFHFQRIYKALQGETPYETLLRLRLEKSVFLLKHHRSLKIAEVAYQCGFPSAENFSRQFKLRFQHSPSAYRKDPQLQNSRIYQESNKEDFYHCIEASRKVEASPFTVTLEKLDVIPIAFIRGIFGDDGSALVQRYLELIAWAEKHGINYQGKLTRFGMSMDDIEVTPAGKYRYDFALAVDSNRKSEGLIEQGTLPTGNYATLHCQGDITVVSQAWDYLYKEWLPQSNFIPKHQPCIEEFIQGPEEIGWKQFNMKCRVAVVRR